MSLSESVTQKTATLICAFEVGSCNGKHRATCVIRRPRKMTRSHRSEGVFYTNTTTTERSHWKDRKTSVWYEIQSDNCLASRNFFQAQARANWLIIKRRSTTLTTKAIEQDNSTSNTNISNKTKSSDSVYPLVVRAIASFSCSSRVSPRKFINNTLVVAVVICYLSPLLFGTDATISRFLIYINVSYWFQYCLTNSTSPSLREAAEVVSSSLLLLFSGIVYARQWVASETWDSQEKRPTIKVTPRRHWRSDARTSCTNHLSPN